MKQNRQLALNMVASFLAYVVTFGINFLLSPYIVKTVGIEAYGFVGLANNFISYAGLITVALNSLAGRFVTIKIYEKDIDGANRYFSSVFIANSIIALVLGIIAFFVLIFLDRIINIPNSILIDVKLLFACMFLDCIIGTIGSVFAVSTFATNKLYLNSARTIESSIMRMIILIVLFAFFAPHVSYLGITTLFMGVYVFLYNVYYTKKLLPELHIRNRFFDIKAIWELISSGVWNLIIRLGQMMSDGVDLLIANLFIDITSMGVLALAKSVPSIITGIVSNIVGIFAPNFTILYAEKKIDELVVSLRQSMKIMGIITNIPIIILIVCGEVFFSVWQPTQNAHQLQILSILTCMCLIISGAINCIYDIFTVVNKLKFNSLIVVICGVLNIIIVFILLKTTSMGIYAIAGVSSILALLRNIFFTAPYGAHCLNQKWYAFYPSMLRSAVYVVVTSFLGYIIKGFIPLRGWNKLFVLAIICIILAVVIGGFVILNKQDRKLILSKIRRKKI